MLSRDIYKEPKQTNNESISFLRTFLLIFLISFRLFFHQSFLRIIFIKFSQRKRNTNQWTSIFSCAQFFELFFLSINEKKKNSPFKITLKIIENKDIFTNHLFVTGWLTFKRIEKKNKSHAKQQQQKNLHETYVPFRYLNSKFM